MEFILLPYVDIAAYIAIAISTSTGTYSNTHSDLVGVAIFRDGGSQ